MVCCTCMLMFGVDVNVVVYLKVLMYAYDKGFTLPSMVVIAVVGSYKPVTFLTSASLYFNRGGTFRKKFRY